MFGCNESTECDYWNEGQENVIVVENSLEEDLRTSESVQQHMRVSENITAEGLLV